MNRMCLVERGSHEWFLSCSRGGSASCDPRRVSAAVPTLIPRRYSSTVAVAVPTRINVGGGQVECLAQT
jgi:hypothetical protein